MATITISGKFGNNTDLARRVVTFLPLDAPFGSGNEVVFGPEFSEVLDENGDASFTMLEGNYLCWLKGYESATATIAVPSGSGTHNINSIFATSTASGLNSVSTGQLDWQDRSTTPSNPPAGFYRVYFRGGTLYKLNSSGTETSLTGSGDTLPVDDTTAVVRDPADTTKRVRIDAGAISTATTRTITMPDADVDLGAVASLPVLDSTALVKDPADATKLVRVDAGAITTGTTRVITMGDRDVDLASGGTFAEAIHNHAASEITSGTLADARVAESNVTQHESALTITESQISDLGSYSTLPVADTTAVVKGSVDATKLVRIEADGLTTATTRVITMPDADVDLADIATNTAHAANTSNPHSVTKSQVGLGNVENTAISTWAGSANITTVGTLASGAVPTSLLTGTLPDARVAESNVTQHEAALTITESQISDLGSYVALDATLDAATGNEVATTLAYTTNKATSGNDTGLLINKTDTASPGTSYLLDLQTGGVRQAGVQDNGSLTANDISATGALSYLHSLNITTGNITAATGNFEATAGDISCASGTLTTSAVEMIGATGSRALYLDGSGFVAESATTDTELGYLSGATSNIQTQLDGKGDASGPGSSTDNAIPRYDGTGGKTFQNSLATIDDTGGISATSSKSYLHSLDITTGSITAATGNFEATAGDISCASGTLTTSAVEMIGATGSRALYLDGSGFVAESATTDTELGYLSGATSNIQTQIDGLPTATSTTTFTNKTHTNPASTKQTLTDGATINWDTDSGHIAQVTLGGNRTMAAPTNLNIGTYILEVIQDGTGSRTITWNAVFKWPGGTAPTLTTAASARDIITFYCDGTNLYGVESLNFS